VHEEVDSTSSQADKIQSKVQKPSNSENRVIFQHIALLTEDQPQHLISQLSSTPECIAIYIHAKKGICFTVFFHFLSRSWSMKELGPVAIYDQQIKLSVLCIVSNFICTLNYQKLYSGANMNLFKLVLMKLLVQIHSSGIIHLKG
jgi:hypothetical protein